jgi:hypothetical protein
MSGRLLLFLFFLHLIITVTLVYRIYFAEKLEFYYLIVDSATFFKVLMKRMDQTLKSVLLWKPVYL